MLYPGSDYYKAPDYKKYKHDTFEKFRNRMKLIKQGIGSCSLKEEDKQKLLKELFNPNPAG